MIINYPTGLYNTVIPSDTESGNVTFTVSNQIPPRTDLLYPKIPKSLVGRIKDRRSRELLSRRATMGELAFTVTKSTRAELGNTERVYATGQILDFNDDPIKTIEPMLVADKTEIIHNSSQINYGGLDILQQDVDTIQANALVIYDKLKTRLNDIIRKRKGNEELIVTNQKIVNDADRTISALTIVNKIEYNSEINSIILKAKAKKADASKKIDQATIIANSLAVQATAIQDQIREISLVIK